MKKFNKMEKWLFGVMGLFCGFAIALGLSISGIKCFAEDVEASAEGTEIVGILDDTATDEDVVDGVENGENSAEIEGILNAVQEYLDSKKDEDGNVDMGAILTDAKTWVIAAISWIMSTFGGAMIAGALNRINKKKDVLNEAQIEKVANAAAKASTEKLIGKSIDVDISAEVSKAVKQELSALNNSVNSLVDGVKNAEMLSAEVAMAQSRSRLLTDEERIALRETAAKVQEHAGKKVISAPKVKIKTKTEKVESAPAVTEDVAQKNMYFINFDGVEKK